MIKYIRKHHKLKLLVNLNNVMRIHQTVLGAPLPDPSDMLSSLEQRLTELDPQFGEEREKNCTATYIQHSGRGTF